MSIRPSLLAIVAVSAFMYRESCFSLTWFLATLRHA